MTFEDRPLSKDCEAFTTCLLKIFLDCFDAIKCLLFLVEDLIVLVLFHEKHTLFDNASVFMG